MTRTDPSEMIGREIGRRLRRFGFLLLAFTTAVAISVHLVNPQDAREALVALAPWKLGVLCALAFAHYLLRALRWHLIVRSGGIMTPLPRTMLHYFGGFAMTATPGRVGEIVRLRWLKRETGLAYSRLLPAAFADRALEMAAIVLVLTVALSVAGIGSASAWWVVAAAALLVGIACRPNLLGMAVGTAWKLSGHRRVRFFAMLRRMTRDLGPFLRLRLAAPALGLGAVGWTFEGMAFWALLTWLGADLGWAASTSIFLVAVLAGTLSGLPGGLGGTEATAVALLLLKGVAPETAVLATAIIRVTTLWFAVGLGLLVFPAAEMRAAALERTRTA